MVEAWQITVACIMAVGILIACIMIVAYFGHPDDTNVAWFPRIVVITGLFVAIGSILVLPYDVSVHQDNGDIASGIRTDVLWQIIYFIVAFYVVVLIPYSYFYYESEIDPEEAKGCNRQWIIAFNYTLAFFVIFVVILVIFYSFLNVAEIGVRRIALSAGTVVGVDYNFFNTAYCDPLNCVYDSFVLNLDVTFPVYLLAFLSFIGWWFFTLFVGVGLVALPLDLINEFRTRPEPLTFQEYTSRKKEMGQRATILVDAGSLLLKELDNPTNTRKQNRANESTYRKFEQAYYFLKKDWEILQISFQLKGGNPLWYIFKLVLGIISIIISIIWIIHICIFDLPTKPPHPFLNQFFIELESAGGGSFPLFGIVAFAIFAFYLIWAGIKGAFKLGVRFIIFKIYPMELHKTMMNAFLANTWVIMLCSVPVVQFCVQSFPVYARLTAVDMLFGTQAQHLRFFRYFWENRVFIYMIVILSFLTMVYLFVWPVDKEKEIERRIAEVARGDED